MIWFRVAVLVSSLVVTLSSAESQTQAQSPPNPIQAQSAQREDALVELKQAIDSLRRQAWIKDWIPFVATLLTAAVAMYSLRSNLQMSERTLREKSREEERKAIREKIDQFYGPFVLLRGKSETLYEELFLPRRTAEERRNFADEQGRYRTVHALVEGYQFDQIDKALLNEIVDIGRQTASLIQTKMGLVDDEDLQKVLARATAHYWVIEQLVKGTLTGGGDEFAKFVFPRDLDSKVKNKLAGLNRRLVELQE